MSEQPGTPSDLDAPEGLGGGTDISADSVDADGSEDVPATNDPGEYRDDPDLGGTHGGSAGGVG
jgi:hypothetical protein